MKSIRTIILGAGKGVRMNSELPKVLHEVCGRPMIHYVLDVAKAVGSLKTCVVVGHKNELVTKYLKKEAKIVIQKKLLGTADAIKSAQSFLKGYKHDVLILSGDAPLLDTETVKKLIKKHKKTKAACTFLTSVVGDPGGYGRVIRNNAGAPVAIREDKDASSYERTIDEINAGVYCFKADFLLKSVHNVKMNKKKKEFYLTDVIEMLAKKDATIQTLVTKNPAEGLGINTREDLAFAQDIMRSRILKKFMSQGVTIVDPSTTFIDCDVKIGADTIIRPCTIVESNVCIGKKCLIGPFCHIRKDTKIGNQVKVGNFAEVSRSMIGDDCFMNHFSFLGDSIVGKRANIGAGVVTANFDGKNKNRTVISDGAFIGSDSILIAPVNIGRNVITGAGCVVTKGKKIPDGSVALGVPAKIISRRKK